MSKRRCSPCVVGTSPSVFCLISSVQKHLRFPSLTFPGGKKKNVTEKKMFFFFFFPSEHEVPQDLPEGEKKEEEEEEAAKCNKVQLNEESVLFSKEE